MLSGSVSLHKPFNTTVEGKHKLNWIITGGCGFLGTALIKRLLQTGGQNIRVLDNLKGGSRDDLALVSTYRELEVDELGSRPVGVELIVGDIVDEELALKVSQGCDVIIHFAANTGVGPSVDNPREDMYANVIGTFNYLEAARINKIPKFVFASSGASSGDVNPPIHEELPAHPVSPYGASKLSGEGYCSAYNRTFGVNTVVLRFSNVYGPGSMHKSSVVAKFIRRALAGDTLEIFGDGKQTRDFIYIDDLIDAVMISATNTSIGGEIFQIASNTETTIYELAAMLASSLKAAGVVDIAILSAKTNQFEVKRNFSDITKARKILGWKPKVTLDKGIKSTIAYFTRPENK